MELHFFARVLWRFKYLVAAGCTLGLALSVLTIAKIDLLHGAPHLVLRTPRIYAGSATLLVTESGFPWGSAVQPYSSAGGSLSPAGDVGRLTSLTGLYVELANSDSIMAVVRQKAPVGGAISASQYYSFAPNYTSYAMPIIILKGTGTSPADALTTTQIGVDALTGYIRRHQREAGLTTAQRVLVQELQRPRATTVVNPPKKTLPVVVFLTVVLAVIGIAFVLENVRPRVPEAVALRPEAEAVPDGARRSA